MTQAAEAASTGPVMCVVGARPNFMKIAPILRALATHVPPLALWISVKTAGSKLGLSTAPAHLRRCSM